MPDAVIHPTPQELSAFGLGKLPEHAAAAVAAHLESCPACRHVVAGVSSDSFLDKVRAAKPDGSSFPPSLARPGNAPISAGRPAIPNVPSPDVPPELARHPKYLILRELNRGGMGVVYQARHKEMNRQIVIKVIKRSLLDQAGALERFRREIQSAAQLSHPNIVTAYDAEQAGDLQMLVMEFVPGQSLAEVLQKKGPLPVANACHYVRQVALGLQHAHERGMVHRDIKPSNLMLMPKSQVKILDFGLAKIISERDTGKGLTSSDAYMGTPDYCAPEQATDARTADIRADLYSLGCTLYCLLVVRPPFHEDTAMKTIMAHMQKQPQPLPELRPDVPAELWQVVKRLLAKEPAQRYQKPIEVFRALSAFVIPGAKPDAKGGSAPPPGESSPSKGTRITADPSQVKKILREVPGKTPPMEVRAKAEISQFADSTDETGAPNDVERYGDKAVPSRPAWWKSPGVMAGAFGVSFALILMTVIIIAAKVQKPDGYTDESRASNKITVEPAQPKSQNNEEDFEPPPRELKQRPGKPEPNPRKNPFDPEPPRLIDEREKRSPDLGARLGVTVAPAKVIDERKEQAAAPRPSAPRSSASPPAAATPVKENKEPPTNPVPAEAKKPTPVDVAIDKGVAALRKLQRADGTWPHEKIGATALAGLTLLECGAPADDNAVLRAADVVRRTSLKLTHTYSIALSILFLDRLGEPDDIPLIESLMVRLLAGQANTGGWTYDCPGISDHEVRRLTDKLAQREELAGTRERPKPGVVKRTLKDLPKEIQLQVISINRGNGMVTERPGDNSNTQFAALGLWVGRRYGLPVEKALKLVEIRFRSSQFPDGRWLYADPDPKAKDPELGSTAAMICAGLFGLAVTDGATLEIRKERNPQNTTPYVIPGRG